MPVDPQHQFSEIAHPKTVVGEGWVYGCNSLRVGPGPRGRTTRHRVQKGWGPVMINGAMHWLPIFVEIESEWKPLKCGHTAQQGRGSDPACQGCENRSF